MKKIRGMRKAHELFYLSSVSDHRLAVALIIALAILAGMGIYFYHMAIIAVH